MANTILNAEETAKAHKAITETIGIMVASSKNTKAAIEEVYESVSLQSVHSYVEVYTSIVTCLDELLKVVDDLGDAVNKLIADAEEIDKDDLRID